MPAYEENVSQAAEADERFLQAQRAFEDIAEQFPMIADELADLIENSDFD